MAINHEYPMVTTPLNLRQVTRYTAWMLNLGTLRHLMWLHWNCSCEAARGSPLLPALLAAAAAGGGSLLAAGFIIWAISGWVCLSRRIRVISRVNAAGSSTSCFRFRQWPIKDNGNEHFTPIFVDYSWSACLDLGEDCHCLVFTQSAFPFFQSSLR